MIYVSEEETVEAGKSPPGRVSRQGSNPRDLGESVTQWAPGDRAQAKLKVVQLLASSFHCWEGWVMPLLPSQAGRSPVPSNGQDQDKTYE